MHYAIVCWIAGAGLTAFIARRRGRGPGRWFITGLMLPVLSIAVLYVLPAVEAAPEAKAEAAAPARPKERNQRKPPARCCGRYIGDCNACPFFSRPDLFMPSDPSEAGYCEHFGRTLWKDGKVTRGKDR